MYLDILHPSLDDSSFHPDRVPPGCPIPLAGLPYGSLDETELDLELDPVQDHNNRDSKGRHLVGHKVYRHRRAPKAQRPVTLWICIILQAYTFLYTLHEIFHHSTNWYLNWHPLAQRSSYANFNL